MMVCSRFQLWPFLLAVIFIFTGEAKQVSLDQTISAEKTSEWLGYKLIQANQELLEHRFSELLVELKQQNEQLLNQVIDRHERNMAELFERLEEVIKPKESHMPIHFPHFFEPVTPVQRPDFGEDWQVVLQRFDGSEDFDQDWTAYRDGFGTVGQEYWLGLEQLHQLTNSTPHELLIELEDFRGNCRYARYSKFVIGSEAESYSLEELGAYSGTAGDSLTMHKGSKFTTKDEGPFKECVESFSGGWWYKGWNGGTLCYNAHLTGKWQESNVWASITWTGFEYRSDYTVRALKEARMSIRKL